MVTKATTTITVGQLLRLFEFLNIPEDTVIKYNDMNFGGVATEKDFTFDCIHFEDGILLIDSLLWEPVD